MTDRELLELAAKAAGMPVKSDRTDVWLVEHDGSPIRRWNPLADDGDRYRLLAKLKGRVDFEWKFATIGDNIIHWPDDEPTAERAIVRAAAEVGKAMP